MAFSSHLGAAVGQRGRTGAPVTGEKVEAAVATPYTATHALEMAAANIPNPSKAHYGGEDAWFTLSNRGKGDSFAVADGVGGWGESDVNPGEYSALFVETAKSFMKECAKIGKSQGTKEFPLAIQAALNAGHQAARIPGSTTACIAELQGDVLVCANVGDSGMIVARNGRVVQRTTPQQHFFDCPLQFGAYPEYVDATDDASDAQILRTAVEAGDVIVMASDGLWDNVYEEEVLELLPTSPKDVAGAAEAIANLAFEHSQDEWWESPYCENAIEEGLDLPWWEKLATFSFDEGRFELGKLRGGKQDDITVVVAYVKETPRGGVAGAVSGAKAMLGGGDEDGGGSAVPLGQEEEAAEEEAAPEAREWISRWRNAFTGATNGRRSG
ncbi:unnamed protein product [Pedinophyceae sp. YPF-701]|nr:unnamed protein product [Pedinophyceae sp. YPF-701]